MIKSTQYNIWCDGSYKPKLNIGGLGTVIISQNNEEVEHHKLLEPCENSYSAEFLAIVFSLSKLPDNSSAQIYSDCLSAVNNAKRILKKRNEPKNNQESHNLLKLELNRLGEIKIDWVKGHNQNPFNVRADRLSKKSYKQRELILLTLKSRGEHIKEINNFLLSKNFLLRPGDSKKVFKAVSKQGGINFAKVLQVALDMGIPNKLNHNL